MSEFTVTLGPGGSMHQNEVDFENARFNHYSLGGHDRYGEMEEYFSGGDFCDAIFDFRSAKITYIYGETTQVLSWSEPTTCYYEFQIQIECDGNVMFYSILRQALEQS